MEIISSRGHLFSLEIPRFCAAYIIFYGHFVHFYMYYGIEEEKGLFFDLLSPFGSLAVPFFFMLSGVVFCHGYGKKINNGEISPLVFAIRRFARLYPLHILTLLIVTFFQFLVFAKTGEYFIYEFNDTFHFILNLFFASHWGFQQGSNFNSPVWSVSHEVIIYFLFFVSIFFMRGIMSFRSSLLLIFSILTVLRILLFDAFLIKSIWLFFLGSVIYIVVTYFSQKSNKFYLFVSYSIIVLLLWNLSSELIRLGLPFGFIGPTLIVFLLLLERFVELRKMTHFNYVARLLGNLTYSTYLMHFPIQLLMVTFSLYVIEVNLISNLTLFAYIILVLLISRIVYLKFETPAKKKILR